MYSCGSRYAMRKVSPTQWWC